MLSVVKKKGYVFYDNKFRRKTRKLTIYIARYKSSTKSRSGVSGPCSNCLRKIKELGIKKIVYADREGNIHKCKSKDYITNYQSVGYREYRRMGIKVI